MRLFLATLILLAAAAAHAQFNGCPPGFCSTGTGGAATGNFLLSNTGSALLVNTGVKFLVQ